MSFTHVAHRTLGSLLVAGSLALVGCANPDPVPSSVALVTGEVNITAIATDDFFVYWATQDGSVKRVPIDGGKPTTLVSGQQPVSTLAVDQTHIFYASSNGEIARTPKEGGAAETLAQAGENTGLAIDPESIYFTTNGGDVQRRSKQDGSMTMLAAGQKVRSQFAVNGASLIWANESAGSVNEMLTTTGAADTLVSAQARPQSVAITGGNIYWTNNGDMPTVGVAQRDGSGVQQIPALGALPTAVMGDDTYVYFADASGAVNVAAIAGGDAVQIAKGPSIGKVSITMDQAAIYWANSQDGSIVTMPRQ